MTNKLTEIFQIHIDALSNIKLKSSNLPYNLDNILNNIPVVWMPYNEMLREFSREIANVVNGMLRLIYRLEGWRLTLEKLDDDDRFEAIIEFIEPFATLALNLPYVIKYRFIFATTHLCHQANRHIDGATWQDDLPRDKEIELKFMDKYCEKWRSYKKLKLALEKIDNQKFQKNTFDFRNKYTHRFPPHIEIGLTGFGARIKLEKNDHPIYGFGGVEPLKLDNIIPLLIEQHEACCSAFMKLHNLIEEHKTRIDFSANPF